MCLSSTSPASAPRTVTLVTLGCARNEVDSEELAARLTAAGWELTEDGDASVVLVNTCGFIQAAKQESIDELLAAAESGAKVAAVGCLAERYGADLAGELPEAQVLSFDDYGEIGARLDDVLAGRKRPAHVARDRRTLLPISPAERQPAAASRRRRRGSRRTVDGPGWRDIPAAAVPRRGRPAEDRVRLRPPVLVLRHPLLPRRVRLPPPARDLGRGPLAGRQRRPRAGPGQRELHLLRQGPGQPAAARGGPARPGRHRGDRAGQDQLPAARRAAAGADRGDRGHPRRGALLRPVVPACQRPGAAGHAAVRRPGAFPRPARPDPGAEPAGRGAVQLHRRLPRRDRGGPGRARDVPEPRRTGRDRDLRLLRRGRHRGGVATRASWTRPRSPAGSRSSPGWPTS